MTNETLRMQMLAGVITEGEYKAKLQENNNKVDYIINKVGNSFRIFASTPKIKSEKGKPEDAESLFGKGTMWKDYSTNSEAQKAIDSLSNSPFDNKRGIDNKSLNEAMIGGIVGIGAINQIPPREKTDYEMAFEHFLGERQTKIENREQDPYTMKEGEVNENNPLKGGPGYMTKYRIGVLSALIADAEKDLIKYEEANLLSPELTEKMKGTIEKLKSSREALKVQYKEEVGDPLQEGELASKEEYKIELKDGYYILTYKNNSIHSKNPESTEKFKTKKEAEEAYKKHLKAGDSIAKQFADGIASGDPMYRQPF